jgi:DNA-binding transcriptional LysR family regulator
MARKFAEIERVVCASPQYLQQQGVPASPGDLTRHRCIVFSAPGRACWPFKPNNGAVQQLDVPWSFASDNLDCILRLALRGAGIARLPDFMVAEPIRSGRLVPLLVEQHDPERTPAFAVFPPGTQKTPKVRVFLDFLVERFGGEPWRLSR